MEISPSVAAFLEEGLAIHIGTRNATLAPNGVRATAARVEANGHELVVYVSAVASRHVLPDLHANGQAAVVFVRPVDDRSCQVKGEFIDARTADENERDFVGRQWGKFIDGLGHIGIPPEVFGRWAIWPSVAIRLKTTALFDQTPGPGAGAAIS